MGAWRLGRSATFANWCATSGIYAGKLSCANGYARRVGGGRVHSDRVKRQSCRQGTADEPLYITHKDLHRACEQSVLSSQVVGRVLARIATAFTLQLAPTGVHIICRRTLVLLGTPLPRPWVQGTAQAVGTRDCPGRWYKGTLPRPWVQGTQRFFGAKDAMG